MIEQFIVKSVRLVGGTWVMGYLKDERAGMVEWSGSILEAIRYGSEGEALAAIGFIIQPGDLFQVEKYYAAA